jgi:hypothetical protein
MMKRKTNPAVRDALLARCILGRSKDGEDNQKIHEAAQLLVDSLFGRLTPDQRDEYARFIERAWIEENPDWKEQLEKFLFPEGSSTHQPN